MWLIIVVSTIFVLIGHVIYNQPSTKFDYGTPIVGLIFIVIGVVFSLGGLVAQFI